MIITNNNKDEENNPKKPLIIKINNLCLRNLGNYINTVKKNFGF